MQTAPSTGQPATLNWKSLPVVWRWVVVAVAVLALVLLRIVNEDYSAFVVSQQDAFNAASSSARAAIADYAGKQLVITVQLTNPTGGTASFFVGTAGAKQEAVQGVEVNRAPDLVDTLQPHQQDSIYVTQWAAKYISSLTKYIFLGTVASPSLLFDDAAFSRIGSTYATIVTAVPSVSDSNYAMIPRDQTSYLSASQVTQKQASDIKAFAEAHEVNAELYSTDFWSYIGSVFRRSGFP